MSKVRTAVIGVGHLGKFHAQKYSQLKNSKLLAVVDEDIEKAKKIAATTGADAFTSYHKLIGQVDAVSIAVPTHLHYDIAAAFLRNHTHVLVEKPITATLEQADKLITLAKQANCTLQVGHLERFNPAMTALEQKLTKVEFIEAHRLAPYSPRGTEVNVVLDLMIHDIDIILAIVDSEVGHIDARGIPVLSQDIDIANARIIFKNGCVANVTASRVSNKTERKMRIFQRDSYLSVDFHHRKLTAYRKAEAEVYPKITDIEVRETTYEESDALLAEIDHFLASIKNHSVPKISGHDGRRALQTAIQITEMLT